MGHHVPCESCGSSDAGWIDDAGAFTCFKCGVKRPSGLAGDAAPTPPSAVTGLVPVEVAAVPVRGINEDTAKKWGYGYGERGGDRCQVATYRDATGRPVAQKLRFKGKKFQVVGDAKKMGLFGQHLWRDGGKMVVVCEGELDALSVSQLQENRWPVVSVPNGAPHAHKAVEKATEWLERFEKVVLMLDDDDEGRSAALKCAAALSPGKAFIATIAGHKDANAALMAGDGKKVIDAMWGAKAFRPDGLISGPDVWQRVLQHKNLAFAPIPHAGLDAKWMGFRPGEITVLVAGTGTGKSTTLREWAAALVAGGVKVGYVGLEEPVERSAMGLVSVAVGRPLHLLPPEELSKPDVLAAAAAIESQVVYYDHHGVKADESLMAKLRFMHKGEGCRVVFLDHLSIVVSGMDVRDNERQVIDRMMTQLSSFVMETGAHVVAVCHLSRKEGTPHEQGRPVTLADLRGSHGISQLAYNVGSLERDQQAEDPNVRDLSVVRSLKCRHTGRTGVAGYVRYSELTGRQIELSGPDAPAGMVADVGDLD